MNRAVARALESLEQRRLLTAGSLLGGVVNQDINGADTATSTAFDSSGKLVVVGNAGGQVGIARFAGSASLVLDSTYNGTGKLNYSVPGFTSARGVVVDPSTNDIFVGVTADDDFVLVRTQSNGASPTASAGVDFGSTLDSVATVVRLPGGAIVAVGSSNGSVALARFNPSTLALDASGTGPFNVGSGTVTTIVGGAGATINGATVDSSGKLVVIATTTGTNNLLVYRYNPDGSLDASFATGGLLTIAGGAGRSARAVATDSSNRILLLSNNGSNSELRRIAAGGSSVEGPVLLGAGSGTGVVIQPYDQRIAVSITSGGQYKLTRLNSDLSYNASVDQLDASGSRTAGTSGIVTSGIAVYSGASVRRLAIAGTVSSDFGVAYFDANLDPVLRNLDAPVTVVPSGSAIPSTITSGLFSNDADNAAADLIYTIASVSNLNGTLYNTNTATPLTAGSSFTQADLNAGYITYTATSPATGGSFTFTFSDGFGGALRNSTNSPVAQPVTVNLSTVSTPPATVWVDDNWDITSDVGPAGLSAGDVVADSSDWTTSLNGFIFGVNAFSNVNDAIAAVAVGGTVNVLSGTYVQNVIINKSLTLLGRNNAVSGTGARSAESTIVADSPNVAANLGAVVRVTADDVTIKGLLVNGDGAGTGLPVYSGADANAFYGISNGSTTSNVDVDHLVVENNIVQQTAIGVFLRRGTGGSPTPGISDGNSVKNNLLRDIGVFDFGYGISWANNVYGDITGNVMRRVHTGVVVNNNGYDAPPSSGVSITNNDVQAYASALWLNQSYSYAPLSTISGNTFDVATTNYLGGSIAAVANSIGLLVTGGPGFSGTTLASNSISGYAHGAVVWGTSGTVSISATNSISGSQTGVLVTNNVGFNPIGTTALNLVGTATTVTLDGASISAGAGGTAVVVRGDAGGGAATVTLQNGVQLGTAATGLRLTGPLAGLGGDSLGNTSFSGSQSTYVELASGAEASTRIDGTSASYDGVVGNAATLAQGFAIEDKISHAVDGPAGFGSPGSVGFVRTTSGNVYVTPASGSIQRGVDAATAGNTVNVKLGTYSGAVSVNKSVTLLGDAAGKPTVTLTTGSASALIRVGAPNVVIRNFTLATVRPNVNDAIYADKSATGNFDGLQIVDNTFTASGTGGTSVHAGSGSRGVAIALHDFTGASVPNVSIRGNEILSGTTAGTGVSFTRGLWTYGILPTVGGASVADGNKLFGTFQDALLQFPSPSVSSATAMLVQNNTLTGAGVEVTEPNANVAVSFLDNTFATNVAQLGGAPRQALFINHNYSSNATVLVGGNTFVTPNGNTPSVPAVGLFIGGSRNVTVTGNTFSVASGATNFVHVLADTQFRDGTQFGDDVPDSLDLRGNAFNAGAAPGGVGLALYNGNSTRTVTGSIIGAQYGTYTIGGAGVNANSFAANLSQFIRLNDSRAPIFGASVPTVPGPVNLNLDVSGNSFDLGAGQQLPASLTLAQRFDLEDKLFHKLDLGSLGLLRAVAGQIFVTPASGSIQRGVDAATAGDTVNVKAGTYAEAVTIDKPLTLDGEGSTPVATITAPSNGVTLVNVALNAPGAAVTIRDIAFAGVNGSVQASYGVAVPSTTTLDTLTVDRTSFTGLNFNAVAVNGDSSTGLSVGNVVLSNSTFTNNGSNTGGAGDISFFTYNCAATLSGLTLANDGSAGARLGIQFRGVGAVDNTTKIASGFLPIGTVSLNDIDVSGVYQTQLVGLQRYANLAGLSFNDVKLGGAASRISGGFGASLRFDAIGLGNTLALPATFNLGNTRFRGLSSSSAQRHEVEIAPDNANTFLRLNGTGTSWDFAGVPVAAGSLSLSQAYAVENRILHYTDKLNPSHAGNPSGGTYKGFVDITPNVAYVTDSADSGLVGDNSINRAIAVLSANGTVNVAAGSYDEDVTINKAGIKLLGSGSGSTTLVGPIGGSSSTVFIAESGVELAGFTITRAGNNLVDWNNSGLNSSGVAIQGQAITGAVIHDNVITGNRTGIDINNSSGHTVRQNYISDNRTGMILRNQTDNLLVTQNFITNNWTAGVLFLDGSGGTNSPLQRAVGSQFFNNDISGNWYGQVVDRQTGGSLPAPGTNKKTFIGNWFGTATPTTSTLNSTEPGYSAQIPVAFGGSAVAPGGQPDILGPASANIDFAPVLTSGTDTNAVTAPGIGTFGFQGNLALLGVSVAGPTSIDEGSLYTLQLSPQNPGSSFITGWTIDWGDGSPLTVITGNPTTTTHTYVDGPNDWVITATAATTVGNASANTVSVTVNNVAPTSPINGYVATSNEGTQLSFTSNLYDPAGANDTYSYLWTVKRNGVNYAVVNNSNSSFSFTPNDNGSYVVTLQVSDEDGGSSSVSTPSIDVQNVAPVAASVGASSGPYTEGSAITATFGASDVGPVDQDVVGLTFEFWITKNGNSWIGSSGNPVAYNATVTLAGTRTVTFVPNDNGTYVVHFRATDQDGASDVATRQFTVDNVNPTAIAPADASSVEGGAFNAVLSGGADVSNASVDAITGSSAAITPAVVIAAPDAATTDANTLRYWFGAYSDAAGTNLIYTPNASQNYAGAFASDNFTLTPALLATLRNSLVNNGEFWIRARVIDKDNGFTEYNRKITVTDVTPTINVSGSAAAVNESGSTNYTLTLNNLFDPGLDFNTVLSNLSPYSGDRQSVGFILVEWGDGTTTTIDLTGGTPSIAGGSTTTASFAGTPANLAAGTGTSSTGSIVLNKTYLDGPINLGQVKVSLFQSVKGTAENAGTPTNVTVNNVAPSRSGFARISANPIASGGNATVSWSGAVVEPSPTDLAAGIRYAYAVDVDNDGIYFEPGEIAFGGTTWAASVPNTTVVIGGALLTNNTGSPIVRTIVSRIIDKDGGFTERTATVTVNPGVFQVVDANGAAPGFLQVTPTGFVARFSRAVNTALTNLYRAEVNDPGLADVVVTLGGSPVRGSIVWNAAGDSFEFVRTGAILADGTYVVSFRSAADGFVDASLGAQLDGDFNNTAGGDFTETFAFSSAGARILSVPDFARWSQPINLPGNSTDRLPIRINAGANLTSFTFTLTYDPALISVDSTNPFTLNNSLLDAGDGWTFTVNNNTPGTLSVSVSTSSLTGAVISTESIVGYVNATATNSLSRYGQSQVVRLSNVTVNDADALGNSGVHVAALLGDTTGNRLITGQDATLIRRVDVALDSGFVGQSGTDAYRRTDPRLLGDVTGNGLVNSADASRVQLFVVNPGAVPEIPPAVAPFAPILTPALGTTGLAAPARVVAPLSGVIDVPVSLLGTGTSRQSSVDFVVEYDASLLAIDGPTGVRATMSGISVVANTVSPGRLLISVSSASGLFSTRGGLFTLAFTRVGRKLLRETAVVIRPFIEAGAGMSGALTPLQTLIGAATREIGFDRNGDFQAAPLLAQVQQASRLSASLFSDKPVGILD
jgi:parallel beta-helix repeat protein